MQKVLAGIMGMRDTCKTDKNGRWMLSQAGCAQKRVSEVAAEWKTNEIRV